MSTPSHPAKSDMARGFSAMAEKLEVTVPAAWPTGLLQLTQTYDACRRCDAEEFCADWLKRTPDSVQLPPNFCPNAAEFGRMSKAKSRG